MRYCGAKLPAVKYAAEAAEEIIMHIFDMVATRQRVDAQRLLNALLQTRIAAQVIHTSYQFASMKSYSSFNVQLRQFGQCIALCTSMLILRHYLLSALFLLY